MAHQVSCVIEDYGWLWLGPQCSSDLLEVEGEGLGGSAQSDSLNVNVSPGASCEIKSFTKELNVAEDGYGSVSDGTSGIGSLNC
jgi:hypothetical protein